MSHKRNPAKMSTGGEGSQALSSSSAWRPSSDENCLKFEDPDGDTLDPSHLRRTSRSVNDAESDAGSHLTSRARKKAKPVKSACVQCQKRKTKCSGQRPVCHFCGDRNLECSWVIGDGLTRTADLKMKLLQANERCNDLEELLGAMRNGTDQALTMLLARLRMGDTLEGLLSVIRLDVSSGEENGPLASHCNEGYPGQSVAVDLLPPNLHYQFDWPRPGPRYHEMQSKGGWSTGPVPSFYQTGVQEPPYLATPDLDQSRMLWEQNDSYHPPDDNPGGEMYMQR